MQIDRDMSASVGDVDDRADHIVAVRCIKGDLGAQLSGERLFVLLHVNRDNPGAKISHPRPRAKRSAQRSSGRGRKPGVQTTWASHS
jgi:hypothetical protein